MAAPPVFDAHMRHGTSVPAWKARWGKECVAEVVQGTLTSRPPKYTVILELDRKLRDMPLPKYATGSPPQGKGLAETMKHYMPINYLHLSESQCVRRGGASIERQCDSVALRAQDVLCTGAE